MAIVGDAIHSDAGVLPNETAGQRILLIHCPPPLTMSPTTAHRHQPTKPSTGQAPAEYWIQWDELLYRSMGVNPEICVCGAKMTVDDAITEPEKITETLARLGIESTGPPKAMRSTGELDYIYDC